MDFQQLLNSITPDIYERFKRAVELGKWPDTRPLTQEQRALCMQAIIAYEQRKPHPAHHTPTRSRNSRSSGRTNGY
jgi:uncharacterized protein YeaC (DUF1315 family)